MKQSIMALVCAGLVGVGSACGTNDPIGPDETSGAAGTSTTASVVTEEASGTFVSQDGTSTRGAVTVGLDATGQRIVALSDDFQSDFATGSVGLYFAMSDTNLRAQRQQASSSVSPRIALLTHGGGQSFDVDVDLSSFGYVIAYCEPVQINLGAAALSTAP